MSEDSIFLRYVPAHFLGKIYFSIMEKKFSCISVVCPVSQWTGLHVSITVYTTSSSLFYFLKKKLGTSTDKKTILNHQMLGWAKLVAQIR
jgi:hypothetical protein